MNSGSKPEDCAENEGPSSVDVVVVLERVEGGVEIMTGGIEEGRGSSSGVSRLVDFADEGGGGGP